MTTKNTACELRNELEILKIMLDNPFTRFVLTKAMLSDLRKQFTDVEVRSVVLGISGALELMLIHIEKILGEDTAAEEDPDTFDDESQDDNLDELLTALLKTLL